MLYSSQILLLFSAWFGCSRHPDFTIEMAPLRLANGHEYYIDRFEYPNKLGEYPKAMLSLDMAKELCASQGKRLCTAKEWRFACMGERNNRYVYGQRYRTDVCFSNQKIKEGHTSLIEKEVGYAKSGEYSSCGTQTGIFDLNGNLEEWVLDDWRGIEGNLEGGAWYSHWQYADCTGRYSREPDYRISSDRTIDSAGARCCWSEADLSEEQIKADATERIEKARKQSSTLTYVVSDEVQVTDTLWIDRYEYPNREGEYPVVGISWGEAQDTCTAHGKHLCRVEEWEQACLGVGKTVYPYGSRHREGVCTDGEEDARPSGYKKGCVSASGAMDMAGGVWEWTGSTLSVQELKSSREEVLREVRGGSWFSDPLKARCKPLVGYPTAGTAHRFPDVGFRCCRGELEASTSRVIASAHTCPSDMALISAGCIDRYEFPNKANVVPKGNVNLEDAVEQCAAQGKHLCTNEEWVAGCSGVEQRRWSYGNEYNQNACNHNAPANKGGVHLSGSHAGCRTPEGIFDMTGNVWEWTSDGSLRGGNWNFSEGMGQCASFASPNSSVRLEENGFRCCASVEEVQALLSR